MKLLPLRNMIVLKPGSLAFVSLLFLLLTLGCHKLPEHVPSPTIATFASGLQNPMGLETDAYGNVWVALSGDGNNNGKVVFITPQGTKYDVFINLESFVNKGSDDVEGPSHLLLDNGVLYILGAYGKMYKADVSKYKAGDLPVEGSALPFEDIGSFVLSYPFLNNTHETHPYNITKGPNGDLYIADAAANAIIHRLSAGVFSVLAEVPGIPNPTPVGPPQVQSVPTGIIWDGHDFLVSTLLGFPFPTGYALIYKISVSGAVSVYQQSFTSLVDISKGNYFGNLVLQHAVFGATGFMPNTGALVWANGSSSTELTGSLNLPVGLKQANPFTWYVSSMGDGTILKITYR